ncbi:MAG: argininosuccinate lyase [Planctomycetota bacterium]
MTRAGGMWGGRFEGDSEAVFRELNDSLPFDWRMVAHDIRGSIAWARALADVGVYSDDELERVIGALDTIATEAMNLDGPPIESGAEDVHTWVEQRLTAVTGELGQRLQTGRSRNDQVATDLRLCLRESLSSVASLIADLIAALLDQAEEHAATPFPAYTHLQSAQPITFGHWCLAYVAMLERDRGRVGDAMLRMNECPLGSAALAGTTYTVDREAIAEELGFDRPTANSADAIASRDHVIEALSAFATLGVHLSRLAEDLNIYASTEFGLVELDDGVTSGSSLMPQKKNPDSLELIRGMSGQLSGALVSMLTTVKALPMSYNKDLQFDKLIIFDAVDRTSVTLRLAARTIRGLAVQQSRAKQLAENGYTNATDLADLLVAAGVPFRVAHERVGRVVREAIAGGVPLVELPLRTLSELLPELDAAAVKALTVESMLAKRDVAGGTAPRQVKRQIAAARARLTSMQ